MTLTAAELRRRFPDAFAVRPGIYWADMLASAAVGWGAFALCAAAPLGSPGAVLALAVATLALYRAVLFIHEIAHLRRGAVPRFEAAWNLLVGIPLLAPSLMYVGSHLDHHRAPTYGTAEDPEYEPIAHWPPWRIAVGSLVVLTVPALLLVRWGVLGPLSRVVPALRPVVVERMSTLVINTSYRRRGPRTRSDRRRWALEEAGAALVAWAMLAGVASRAIPLDLIARWYAIVAAILVLNHARTLAAHRYESRGERLDASQQVLDSVNVVGSSWLTALLAPVGLRFHALHHLAPTLPYHGLGRVHRRLAAELPDDAPYRRTEAVGIWPALRALYRRAAHRETSLAADPTRG